MVEPKPRLRLGAITVGGSIVEEREARVLCRLADHKCAAADCRLL
jgi:hypothetical protein